MMNSSEPLSMFWRDAITDWMSMNQENMSINEVLSNLRGKRAWGLVRTYGSMFFLEIGEPLPRPDAIKVHGEWHFLVELCHWRIESDGAILIGSDDEQELIDYNFSRLELGMIEAVDASPPSHDLRFVFSSGIRLNTFSTTSVASTEAKQWIFYTPGDEVWGVTEGGRLYRTTYNGSLSR